MLTPLEYWHQPEQSQVAIVRSVEHWQHQQQRRRYGIGNEQGLSSLIHQSFTYKTPPGIRSGDKRPADQLTVEVFQRPLTLGGEVEFTVTHDRNFSLDAGGEDHTDEDFSNEIDDDHSTSQDNSLSAEAFYQVSETVSVFASATAYHSTHYAGNGERSSEWALELDQFWFGFEQLFDTPFDFRFGKQYLYDDRQWWLDAVLDSVTLSYWGESFTFELAVGEEIVVLSNRDSRLYPEDKDILLLLGQMNWEVFDDHTLSLFYVAQKDHSATERAGAVIDWDQEDPADTDLRWLGLRVTGDWDSDRGYFNYWVDTAWVRGRETVIDFAEDNSGETMTAMGSDTVTVEGWALDLGFTWEADLSWSPSLTLSYAVGSGTGDAREDWDTAFRQSGLQSNSNSFNGINYFYYYGELLNPELSNLRIATLAAGMPLFDNSSVEILYHKYNQYKATDFLRGAALETSPSGTDSDIGEEIDIILGLEEWVHWELAFIAAFFKAGDAFDHSADELARSIFFKVNYNF